MVWCYGMVMAAIIKYIVAHMFGTYGYGYGYVTTNSTFGIDTQKFLWNFNLSLLSLPHSNSFGKSRRLLNFIAAKPTLAAAAAGFGLQPPPPRF